MHFLPISQEVLFLRFFAYPVESSLEDGRIAVLVFVELAGEGMGQDGTDVRGLGSLGAGPEEAVGAVAVVREVLDEERVLVDDVDGAADVVGQRFDRSHQLDRVGMGAGCGRNGCG